MNRLCSVAVAACVAGSAVLAVADSNQMSTTRPSTQPLLSGKVITQDAATPTTMPSNKPAAYMPPTNTGGVLLNGGIGATVAPATAGGVTAPPLPGSNGQGGVRTSTTGQAR